MSDRIRCSNCGGTGLSPDEKLCPTCSGYGSVAVPDGSTRPNGPDPKEASPQPRPKPTAQDRYAMLVEGFGFLLLLAALLIWALQIFVWLKHGEWHSVTLADFGVHARNLEWRGVAWLLDYVFDEFNIGALSFLAGFGFIAWGNSIEESSPPSEWSRDLSRRTAEARAQESGAARDRR